MEGCNSKSKTEGCNSECTGVIKVPFECKSDDISVNEPAADVSDEESERKSVSSLKTSNVEDVPPREGVFKRIWKRTLELRRRIKENKIKKKKSEEGKSKTVKVKKEKIKKPKEIVQTLNPEEFTGDRKWLWDEFELGIGVPKRVDTTPSTALRNVRFQRFKRFVPESYFYNEPKKRDAVFLSSKTPIKKCMCPLRECFCIDNDMKKKKCIPGWCRMNFLSGYIEIPIDIPRLHLFDLCCRRPKINRYVEKLEATVDNLKPPMGLRSMGKVNKEFCITKCKRCQAKAGFQHFQYVPTFPKSHKTIFDEKSSQPQEDEVDNKKTNGQKKNRRRVGQKKLPKEPTKEEPTEKQKEDQIEPLKEESNKEQKEEQNVGQAEKQTDQKKETIEERPEEQKEGQQKEQKEDQTENKLEEAKKTQEEQNNKEENEDEKMEETIEENEESENKESEERKKLHCNSYSCTVWTQTEFGPNGELDITTFSHLVFASVEKIILPDITGTKLYLNQCKYVPDCSPVDSEMMLRNMDKLLDVNDFGSFMGCDNETCPKIQPIKHSDISTAKNNHINYDKDISEAIRGKGIICTNKMNKCDNPNCYDIHNNACENEASVVEINKVSNANVNTVLRSDVILCSNDSDENFKNKIVMESERNESSLQEIPGNMENSDNKHEKISSCHILNETKENNSQEGFTKTEVTLVKLPPEDKDTVRKNTNSDELKLNMCPNEDPKLMSQIRFIQEIILDNYENSLNTNTKILDDNQQTAIKDNENETGSLKEPDRDQGLKSQKDSKTSKDKVDSAEKVLPKKSTYTFSSTYRWLMDKLFTSEQMKKKLSAKSCTNDSKLKLKKSGMSEREVFSMRYTSTASIQKNSSEGNN
ncbi:unnamed protein product [Danaus chrysippus]|uniref:(African queen) hypothetical protein n=1 Tax=Danaus chrysippus TaxID=151541 RepID=A0A8J2W1T2_9NEOP|nr:unnamed protein product [Danaus chrysippus]